MGLFERYLSLWVGLCIVCGTVLGLLFPALFAWVAALEFAQVNLVVALLIWLMILPMLLQIDFSAIGQVFQQPRGLVLTVTVNWLIKPFSMAAIAWLFFTLLFKDWVDPQTASEYMAGMILLGVAPCTAMVFVWSQLTKGDAAYTLVQVAVNDLIMVFAFAPIAALLLGLSNVTVPWQTLLLSTMLYVVLPLIVAILIRKVRQGNVAGLANGLKPFSMLGLLLTVLLLFAFQAEKIIQKPLDIVLIAIPLMLQTYIIFILSYTLAKRMQLPHCIAGPASLIGTSNFFELAVAVAISLFGLHSGAALATVVGVLVEVPVMLSLVAYVNKTADRFAPA
ncbi:MAG: ACR3 family arsenite efflux transporter [Pseudomonadales bacterium]|nr:ACR3 family arsenite efflux transporter [Pseudomonadales bacterium]